MMALTLNERLFSNIFKWSLLGVILILFLAFLVNHHEDFYFLLHLRWSILILILFLNLVSESVAGYRFYLVFKSTSPTMRFFSCLKYFVIGRFLNKIIPHGGGAYRAFILKKVTGIKYKTYVSGILAYTWLNIILSIVIGAIVVALLDPELQLQGVKILNLFMIFIFLGIISIPIFNWILNRMDTQQTSSVLKRITEKTHEVVDTIRIIVNTPGMFIKNTLLIIINIAVGICLLYFCFQSIGAQVDISLLVVFIVISRLGRVLVITPGNFGTRELLYGLLSKSAGVGMAEGITVSMILRISRYFTLGLLTIFYQLSNRSNNEQLNHKQY